MSDTPVTINAEPQKIFSASRMKRWMTCPAQAHFIYDLKLPGGYNAKTVFGTVIHHCLDLYNNGMPVEKCVALFIDLWQDPAPLGYPDHGRWPRMTNYGGLRSRGIDILNVHHQNCHLDKREILGTEHRFLVPFGKHLLTGAVDLLEIRRTGKGKDILRIVDYKTAGRQPNMAELSQDVQFCADAETQILTRLGWRDFGDLAVGDDVLTLNTNSGKSEWQPTEAVNVFDAKEQELLALEGVDHSSLTTMNHRWPVEHVVTGRSGWREEKRIVQSADLTGSDRIICAAETANLPRRTTHTDALVELVGWFWTEGHYVAGGSISIAQSRTVNPANTDRIIRCLTHLFGDSSDSIRGLSTPAWRQSNDNDCVRFYLNRAASNWVTAHTDDFKVVDPVFIASLTREQLDTFVQVSMAADGHGNVITQRDKGRLDSFQMACSLLGIRSSLRARSIGGAGRYAGRPFWELSLKPLTPRFVPSKAKRATITYTGKVWCPTTANGTWFARRHGHTFFTGNTIYYYASLQREFWVGDPTNTDFPALKNGEFLWEKYKDMPRRAIWFHLWGQKEIDAGPRGEDDFARLYRLAKQISQSDAAGINIPRIGEACNLCDFTSNCGVHIPTAEELRDQDEAWI